MLRRIPPTDVDSLSDAISVVSQALSVETGNRVSGDTSLSNQVSVVSNTLSNETSIRVVRDDVLSNAISAVSQAISVVSNTLSNETSNRVSADAVLSAADTVISNAASDALSVANAASNAVSNEISNRISADNALSNTISNTASIANDARSIANTVSNALSNETSNRTSAVAAETSDRISADNVLSGQISALSQAISVISQQVSVLSQQVSVISNKLSVLSVVVSNLGGPQTRLLTSLVTVSSTTLTNVSGLSISVAALGSYLVEGRVTYSVLTGQAIGFGLDWPAAVNPRVFGEMMGFQSLVNGGDSFSTSRAVVGIIHTGADASVVLSLTMGATPAIMHMKFGGFFTGMSAGALQLMVQASTGAGRIVILDGYIRAFKIE